MPETQSKISLLLFLFLLTLLSYFYIDIPLDELLSPWKGTLQPIFKSLGYFFAPHLLIPLFPAIFLLLYVCKKRYIAHFFRDLALYQIIMGGSGYFLKIAIGRGRPGSSLKFHPWTMNSTYDAFPSGHVVAIFALAMALSQYFPQQSKKFFTVAILLGITRFLGGFHYLSDCLGAVFLVFTLEFAFRDLKKSSKLTGISLLDN